MKKQTTVEYCDNPICTNPPIILEPEAELFGYRFGPGRYDDGGGGGPLPELYVCSLDCLVPAVEHAIKELWK